MIREHPKGASVLMECTNCKGLWLIRHPTDERLKRSADRHFKQCNTHDPEPLPKMPRIYDFPSGEVRSSAGRKI